MQNKVVVHYLDHKIIKGNTGDFFPHKQHFHLAVNETNEVIIVEIKDLKAIYFVKSFEGNPDYREKGNVGRSGVGKRIKVVFKDGETTFGYTQGFSQDRIGFMVFPADTESNNERIFINKAATEDISMVKDVTVTASGGDDEKKDSVIDEDVIISCSSCGVKNRLKTSKIILKPKCGRCGKALI
ncbi:hypothetical protein BMS3Bbin05_00793 [bacterium BMS3Bbin05]|nr:hypothetical protein BMS3Bbin05_00793 [bacterium BMS3Bbin05]HDL20837.1 hypothetical protein [Nitrospirota bacterium]HDO23296.1 hypothetical protein [Nitrospirota bacterium]HDZ87470.1 hypothetical protein [Nitrospirota bacterium]